MKRVGWLSTSATLGSQPARFILAQSAEIISVGLQLEPTRRSRVDFGGNPVFFCISLGGDAASEGQLDLRLHITRTGPAHQRVGPLGLCRGEFENPFI